MNRHDISWHGPMPALVTPFNRNGSIDEAAQRNAAEELLRVLDASEQRLHEGYLGVEIPNLQARFTEARARLTPMVGGDNGR